MLVSAHDGGVNHHVLVVVIAGQEPENPLENAALGPSVEARIDDLPLAKALGRSRHGTPARNLKRTASTNRRLSAAARQNVFDPIPLVVAQGIASHSVSPPRADHSGVR